jgi:hypothetical protein
MGALTSFATTQSGDIDKRNLNIMLMFGAQRIRDLPADIRANKDPITILNGFRWAENKHYKTLFELQYYTR